MTTAYSRDEKLEKTTLFTYLKDNDSGPAAPIGLEHCSSLEMLVAFVKDSWGCSSGGHFDSIQCILPWKTENQIILIRENMIHSFDHMMKEILGAPVWGEAGQLEVKLIVAFTE